MLKRAVVLALTLYGCGSSERGPNLVELREVYPRHVDSGERFRIGGSGFPEGRSARIVLKGNLVRAGEPVTEGVEIATHAELSSPHTLDVVVTPELTDRLCGKPDARHTTFRGDVEVSFAPRTNSGSPIGGVLEGVVLDITPEGVSADALAALRAEGKRYAGFIGVELNREEAGLTVARVTTPGRAARAGLLAGDIVTELDGMTIRDFPDLVPPPNSQSSLLVVQRGTEHVPVRVESAGFRYHSSKMLESAVLLVGAILVPLLVLGSCFGRTLAYVERRLADRLRQAAALPQLGVARASRAQTLLADVGRKLPTSFLSYFGWVVSNSLFAFLAFGKTVFAAELDLLVVPMGACAGLVVAALASGGSGRRWSLRAGLARSLGALCLSIPLLAALFAPAFVEDNFRMRDLVAAQGPFPWQWLLFKSPALLVLGMLAVAALIPSIRGASELDVSLPSAGERLLDVAEWTHKLIAAGLLAIALFGGWRLPGSSDTVASAVLGALVLLSKAWLLLGVVGLVRWVIGRIDVLTVRGRVVTWLVAPSAVCAAIAVGWSTLVKSPVLSPVDHQLGKILCGAGVVLTLYLGHRVSRGLRAPTAELGVQSWL